MTISDVPLVYTSRGNLPADSLKLEVEWVFSETYIQLIERYRAEDGEIVKQGGHVYLKTGLTGMATPGQM